MDIEVIILISEIAMFTILLIVSMIKKEKDCNLLAMQMLQMKNLIEKRLPARPDVVQGKGL
jgi:hypothetical protein